MTVPPVPGRLLSLETLEERSEVSRHTWRAWVRAGKIPVTRLGRRILVSESAYLAFIAKTTDRKK